MVHFGHRAPSRPTLSAVPVFAVVGLTYETMFSALGTYGLSRTQPNILTTFSKLTPSAMISSPTVRVEDIDGCSSNGGRARPAEDFRGVQLYMDRILSRAGVHARRERSPIFCAGGTSLETCSCVNLRAAQIVRPLEL